MINRKICFGPTDILIPHQTNMEKWSTVACDQYTSQPEYWEQVRAFVGDAPSTLKLMIPEVDLENADPALIHRAMNEYLENDIFRTLKDALIYVKRRQSDGKLRQGLVGALDLECYDYHKGATSLCRATEGTVEERLPPRIRVRKGAPIEMPHIMILIDDPTYSVIEPFETIENELEKIYDFPLMQGGGHITGYAVYNEQSRSALAALEDLMGESPNPLLYAVGDGNHSLATAKACYEALKEQLGPGALHHPARYCLVELVNIHSPALEFEPIHRVLFHADRNDLFNYLFDHGLVKGAAGKQQLKILNAGKSETYSFSKEYANLTVGSLQYLLDRYLSEKDGQIDYIHGADVVEKLSQNSDSIGFLLPAMQKKELFPAVISDGALPRKTFSMGHAQDKRFYVECRRIDQK